MTGKPVLIVVCLLYGLVETLCCSCDCKPGGYYITQYYHLPKIPTSKLRPVIRQPQNPIIEQSAYQLKPVMEQPEFDLKPMMKQPVFQLMPMMMTQPAMKQPETQPMTNENPPMDMSMSMEEVMKNMMENKPMDTPKLLDMMKKPEMKKDEVKNDKEEEKKPVEPAEKSLTDSISEDLDQFKPQPMEMKKDEMPVIEPVKEMAESKNDAVVTSMFEQTVGKDDKEGGSEKGEHHHDKNAYYKFEYAVNDKKTKDVKHQREVLKGDKIEGEYSLMEEDGNIRTVKYTADWKNGFRAIVHNSKKTTFPYN